MPDTVVLRGTLPAVLNDTLDLTSSGFGTPAAALVFLDSTGPTDNPNTGAAGLSVGMYDGTDQRVMSIYSADNAGSTNTKRYMNSGAAAAVLASSGLIAEYSASFITDGIRLTMDVDATTTERFVTVVLFKGVQAKVLTFTPAAGSGSTQESTSLGFAPKSMVAVANGSTVQSSVADHAIMSLGFAGESDGNRQVMFGSSNNVSTSVVCSRMETDSVAGQLFNNSLSWTSGVTTWGTDTFTMTSQPGNSGGDDVCCLVLDEALTCQLGSLDASNTTGDQVVSTTGFDPEAVVIAMTNRDTQDSTGTSGANNEFIGVGAGDTNGSFAHGHTEGDNLGTSNTKSESSATDIIEVHSDSAAELIASLSSLGTEQFTLNYSVANGSATRRGWYVAFGAATGGGGASGSGAADGTSTASGVAPPARAAGTSAGTATAAATPASPPLAAAGTSGGTSTASATASNAQASGSAQGQATASATASGQGSSGTAAGASAASGSSPTAKAAGTASGSSSATGMASLVAAAVGTANGTSSGLAVSAVSTVGTGTAAGVATATGRSQAVTAGHITVQSACISVARASATISTAKAAAHIVA